jgi:hypothetical protein
MKGFSDHSGKRRREEKENENKRKQKNKRREERRREEERKGERWIRIKKRVWSQKLVLAIIRAEKLKII